MCLDLGVKAWIAWLVGPAVDLSVVGLLAGMRFLSLHVISSPCPAVFNVWHEPFPMPGWRAGSGYLLPCP